MTARLIHTLVAGATLLCMLLAGVAIVILDIFIDFVWAHPSVSRSDQPALNQRAAQAIAGVRDRPR